MNDITLLVGLQRDVLFYIFHECEKYSSRISRPFRKEEFVNELGISQKCIKTVIARLKNKHFLMPHRSKNGRGGWSQYEIPKNIYYQLLQVKKNIHEWIDSK